MPFLQIKNLHVEIDGKKILNGLDLTVEKGKVHAIMGPNGSGKSTLAYVLAGKEDYKVTEGQVLFEGADLARLPTHARYVPSSSWNEIASTPTPESERTSSQRRAISIP